MQYSRRKFITRSASVLSIAAANNLIIKHTLANVVYGAADGIARLHWNENPYGPSKKAIESMIESTYQGAYYPDHLIGILKSMIAEKHDIQTNQIAISSGSTQVLSNLSQIMSRTNPLLGMELGWDTHLITAEASGGVIIRQPNGENLEINLNELESTAKYGVSAVSIINPNNPTGTLLNSQKLKKSVMRMSKNTLVIVDEAYNEITNNPENNTMIGLIKNGHNVAVSRTFSKIYGLAGQRIGYIISQPDVIQSIIKNGTGHFSISLTGLAGAISSYNDQTFLDYSKSKIIEAREMINEAILKNGLSALPSQTNFIFVNLGQFNANDFQKLMMKHGVLIQGQYGAFRNWSRVSMGKIEDIKRYINALPKVLDTLNS